jgi:exportin-2 (importin alpha re-exporter)
LEQVSLIGRSDFPDKWPELLPNLVAKLNTDNFDVINGVMQTANSLFKRYACIWCRLFFPS